MHIMHDDNQHTKQFQERDGHYYVSKSKSRAPVPIKMTLASIDNALDSRLWTHLPETGASYSALHIDQKKRSLQTALRANPERTEAQQASGMPIHVPCNNVHIYS